MFAISLPGFSAPPSASVSAVLMPRSFAPPFATLLSVPGLSALLSPSAMLLPGSSALLSLSALLMPSLSTPLSLFALPVLGLFTLLVLSTVLAAYFLPFFTWFFPHTPMPIPGKHKVGQ